MIKVIRAKFHGLHVTDANLEYQGSITLDPIYLEMLNIYPLEFVEIWNKNNGERFSTYVIYGEPGSKCCVLNGAAARKCQNNDQMIIAAYRYCLPEEIANSRVRILTFNKDNSVDKLMEYQIGSKEDNFSFSVVEVDDFS